MKFFGKTSKRQKLLAVLILISFTLGMLVVTRPNHEDPKALKPQKEQFPQIKILPNETPKPKEIDVPKPGQKTIQPSLKPSPTPTQTPLNILWPEPGTYWYKTHGSEDRGLVILTHIDYPARTRRIITLVSQSYFLSEVEEKHIFSEPDTYWRVTTERYQKRTDLTRFYNSGGDQEVDVRPTPPLIAEKFPYRVGNSWSGSWTGNIYGSYTRKVAARGELLISGEDVEVFKLETYLTFHGEYEGSAYMEDWISPKYKLITSTYFETQGRIGLGEYKSRVKLELESIHPI